MDRQTSKQEKTLKEGRKHIGRNLDGCVRREGDEDQNREGRETKKRRGEKRK